MKAISNALSYIFHPLFIVTWMLALLLYTNQYSFAGIPPIKVIGIIVFDTLVFPLIFILLMKRLDLVSSLNLEERQERIIPLVVTITCYIWAYLSIKKSEFPNFMVAFMLGALIALCISFFINVFYKLSLHMVGMSGAMTALMFYLLFSQSDVSYYFLMMVVLTGAVGSARLYLKAHTLQEVYTGFLVGMFGQILGLLFTF